MKYIPIIMLIIIIIIPAVTLLSLRKEIGLKQTEESKVLFFYGNQDYRFSFVSPKDNLNSVVVKLKNISIKNSKPVYFRLLDNQDIVKQIQINGSNIGDSSMVRFAFAAIKDSKDRRYTISLTSPQTEKNEALGIHTDTLNHPVIITYHIPSSRLQLISDIYKNLGTKILTDKILLATWLLLFYVAVFLIRSLDI
ncbi:hypothetical protein A3I48_00555 [Candidatus Daviesbacteria bacterium RIFCSPLOWO2_02_FULL_36_7]|uniref:Uncharacterized protein n=1 Tax=Candidatus Daviesbacteria bacterium RIFCSPLOWO2_02_FULL_36_7 TaxID=1797792 RepID=A0A1F5MHF6_9BACT|nr:MAG: hypothetical protein A3I48_00555 [Candidatus Daviesbacteria bacterium RIFCSPLOWO2_02_FULL_36_7]